MLYSMPIRIKIPGQITSPKSMPIVDNGFDPISPKVNVKSNVEEYAATIKITRIAGIK